VDNMRSPLISSLLLLSSRGAVAVKGIAVGAGSSTLSISNRGSLSPVVASPLAALSDNYGRLVKQHYLPMAFLQAGVLASSADTATQLMEHSLSPTPPWDHLVQYLQTVPLLTHLVPHAPDPVNFGHVLAMATVASTFSGAVNAMWLKQLEEAFPGRGAREVAAKTLIHAVVLASIINSAYLVGVPLLTHLFATGQLPPSGLFGGWTFDEFVTLTKLEVCMFIPYNTIAFKWVAPQVRPLTHAMVSATFNVCVSAVTLGFFDVWCSRAMSALG